jgi:sugar phosphate isomerase/epimerase
LYDPSHFVLQQLDYIQYIDFFYHERIKAFHVKDAEFNPTGKQGTFEDIRVVNRAGRYRSPGDGQVDFKTIFSKLSVTISKDGL